MAGEEETAVEEGAAEEPAAEEEAVAPAAVGDLCPFCNDDMAEADSVGTREGTVTVKRCVSCGFEAKFVK